MFCLHSFKHSWSSEAFWVFFFLGFFVKPWHTSPAKHAFFCLTIALTSFFSLQSFPNLTLDVLVKSLMSKPRAVNHPHKNVTLAALEQKFASNLNAGRDYIYSKVCRPVLIRISTQGFHMTTQIKWWWIINLYKSMWESLQFCWFLHKISSETNIFAGCQDESTPPQHPHTDVLGECPEISIVVGVFVSKQSGNLSVTERQRATDCFYAKKTVTQRKRERRGGWERERDFSLWVAAD